MQRKIWQPSWPVILMSAEPGCDLPSRRAVIVKSLIFRFGSNFASWSRRFDPFKLKGTSLQ
jgi:hypothetical protein